MISTATARTVLAVLAVLAAAPATAAPRTLDAFIGDLDTTCRGSEPFEAFLAVLRGRHIGPAAGAAAKAKLPPAARWAVARARLAKQASHVVVSAPLAGFYRGLRVRRIELAVDSAPGAAPARGVAVAFGTTLALVEAVLGATVRAADARLRPAYGHEVVSLLDLGGAAKLVCNLTR